MPFSPREYWEERLATTPGITGVGYAGLDEAFNLWQYRLHRVVVARTARALSLAFPAISVLDVGSGTGVYLELWQRLGAGHVTGLDLTETAVTRLRAQFPGVSLAQADIGEEEAPFPAGSFDLISAFDIVFHIMDDTRYAQAFRNMAMMLKPGGHLLVSDFFLHGPAQRAGNMVSRPLSEVEAILADCGLEVVSRRPFFYLMNQPIDCPTRWQRFLWRLTVAIAHRISGQVAGALLYPIELLLTAVMRESPSTELMVCRKR